MENPELLGPTESHHHRSETSIKLSDSDKFFSKLLKKETDHCINTNRNPSFRVYYGGTKSSVPFFWETAPGTAKHTLSLNKDGASSVVVRPLTPPPRYITCGSGKDSVKTGTRRMLEGWFGRRIRSRSKVGVLHFKYLFESRWKGAFGLGGKDLVHVKSSWRSMYEVRFWSRCGIVKKSMCFGGCFSS